MSIHIGAKPGEIAERVILPGDPLRAKFIAETYLEDVRCYSTVRNMFGFTGTYKGKEVSVQGTGMGGPSISIYINELIQFYGAKRLVRTGTCGSVDPTLGLGDVVIVKAAAADIGMNQIRFGIKGLCYPPTADFYLLRDAVDAAEKAAILKAKYDKAMAHFNAGEDPDLRSVLHFQPFHLGPEVFHSFRRRGPVFIRKIVGMDAEPDAVHLKLERFLYHFFRRIRAVIEGRMRVQVDPGHEVIFSCFTLWSMT